MKQWACFLQRIWHFHWYWFGVLFDSFLLGCWKTDWAKNSKSRIVFLFYLFILFTFTVWVKYCNYFRVQDNMDTAITIMYTVFFLFIFWYDRAFFTVKYVFCDSFSFFSSFYSYNKLQYLYFSVLFVSP